MSTEPSGPPAEERRSGKDRRSGLDRRSGVGRRDPRAAQLDELEQNLRSLGRQLVCLDEHVLLLSVLTQHVFKEVRWAGVWEEGDRSILRAVTGEIGDGPVVVDARHQLWTDHGYEAEVPETGVVPAGAPAGDAFLGTPKRIPGQERNPPRTTRYDIDPRNASKKPFGSLLSFPLHRLLIEFYSDNEDEDLHLIREATDRFYQIRHDAEERFTPLASETPGSFALPRREQRLFETILAEVEWRLDSDLGKAHLFLYDAYDRMLYYQATNELRLKLDPSESIEYPRDVLMAKKPAYIEFVMQNIANNAEWSVPDRERLAALLHALGGHDSLREQLRSETSEKDLQRLLTCLPQEPGTGVAGNTARTLIPQVSRPGESSWEIERVVDKRFSVLLAVEQLFGVANRDGRMAAVPLVESGQVAGVLFVTSSDPVEYRRLLPSIQRFVAEITPRITYFRSRKFYRALLDAVAAEPDVDLATVGARLIHHVLNVLLTVVCHVDEVQTDGSSRFHVAVTSVWGFQDANARYGPLSAPTIEGAEYRKLIHGLVSAVAKNKIEILDREVKSEYFEHLPPFNGWEYPRSAVAFQPAGASDLLVVYLAESARVVEANLNDVRDKLDAFDVLATALRPPVPGTLPDALGESPQWLKLLEDASRVARRRRILILGEEGSGKTVIAKFIYSRVGAFYSEVGPEFLKRDADQPAEGARVTLKVPDDMDQETVRVLQTVLCAPSEHTEKTVPVSSAPPPRAPIVVMSKTEGNRKPLWLEGRHFLGSVLEVPSLSQRPMDIPLIIREQFSDWRELTPQQWLRMIKAPWKGNLKELQKRLDRLRSRRRKRLPVENPAVEAIARLLSRVPRGTRRDTSRVRVQDVTHHLLPFVGRSHRSDGTIQIFLDDHTYPPDQDPKNDWTRLAARAFRAYAGTGAQVESYYSMGCGAGLDAVAATLIFGCKRVVLSDVHEEVVQFARENLLLNCPDLDATKIDRIHGNVDLFNGVPADQRCDLIFENLPNLPERTDLIDAGHLSSTYFSRDTSYSVPLRFRQARLDLHYLFLRDAKRFLRPGGAVICSIGARVGWDLVEDMFGGLGYSCELLVYDFKRQSQAAEVLGGYVRAENEYEDLDRAGFRFYDCARAREIIGRKSIEADDVRGYASVRSDIDAALSEARLSATAAAGVHAKGKELGHMVWLVLGQVAGSGGGD